MGGETVMRKVMGIDLNIGGQNQAIFQSALFVDYLMD